MDTAQKPWEPNHRKSFSADETIQAVAGTPLAAKALANGADDECRERCTIVDRVRGWPPGKGFGMLSA
jgi:hypothetical protein